MRGEERASTVWWEEGGRGSGDGGKEGSISNNM